MFYYNFGFKKNFSIVLHTSMLKSTIGYYYENKTDCCLLLFDASNAFDKVDKLFNRLRDRNMWHTGPIQNK